MNTLNLTIPLTIPQLAEMLRAQFSPAERQQLVDLVKPSKPKTRKSNPPSVADDLREAFVEIEEERQGKKQFRNLADVLNGL